MRLSSWVVNPGVDTGMGYSGEWYSAILLTFEICSRPKTAVRFEQFTEIAYELSYV
jgi:hypothetical protein